MSALSDAEFIRHKDNFVSLLELYYTNCYFPTVGIAVVTHHGQYVSITYRRK